MEYNFLELGKGDMKGWYCLIDTQEKLDDVIAIKTELAAMTYLHMRDVQITGTKHHTSYSQLAELKLDNYLMSQGRTKMNLAEACTVLEETFTSTPRRLFESYGSFLLNKAGAMMPPKHNYVTFQTVVRDELVFPEDTEVKLNIFQWPNGSHWYATMGNDGINQVVRWDGKEKWDTYSEAVKASEKFAIKYKIKYVHGKISAREKVLREGD